ncbi:hypothetical protein AVEN_30608-1 [Araneus ventricosus]|uniref:Uncharacterized protein n=1 Tax=Araneus ventricosus TaxID=182803 RepID=A0A4Y2MHP0_ARAVE|nr:hypothetical protein AVEN_30608-1 [Araneus ventricosus]
MVVASGWLLHTAAHGRHNQLIHLEFGLEVTVILLRTGPEKNGPQTRPKLTSSISQVRIVSHCLNVTSNMHNLEKIQDYNTIREKKKGIVFELLPRVP